MQELLAQDSDPGAQRLALSLVCGRLRCGRWRSPAGSMRSRSRTSMKRARACSWTRTPVLKPLLTGLAVDTNVQNRVAMMSQVLMGRPNLEKVARETDLYLRAPTQEDFARLVDKLPTRITSAGRRPRQHLYVALLGYRPDDGAAHRANAARHLRRGHARRQARGYRYGAGVPAGPDPRVRGAPARGGRSSRQVQEGQRRPDAGRDRRLLHAAAGGAGASSRSLRAKYRLAEQRRPSCPSSSKARCRPSACSRKAAARRPTTAAWPSIAASSISCCCSTRTSIRR